MAEVVGWLKKGTLEDRDGTVDGALAPARDPCQGVRNPTFSTKSVQERQQTAVYSIGP